MGASKSEHFSIEQNDYSLLFKALGHPARIAIIQHLISTNSCVCGDLVDVLPLSQATVSQHLKELKQANIIKGSIEGNSICYCLNQDTMLVIQKLVNQFIETNETNKNQCC